MKKLYVSLILATGLLFSTNAMANTAAIRSCMMCHTITKNGPSKMGPNMFGIVGHKVASKTNYNYSEALKALHSHGVKWTEASLVKWLVNPQGFVKQHGVASHTKMSFRVSAAQAKQAAAFLATLK